MKVRMLVLHHEHEVVDLIVRECVFEDSLGILDDKGELSHLARTDIRERFEVSFSDRHAIAQRSVAVAHKKLPTRIFLDHKVLLVKDGPDVATGFHTGRGQCIYRLLSREE